MHISDYFISGPTCLAQLGAFAKLPPELRLMIWEEVFRLISPSPYEDIRQPNNILSILRCSRYLYHEISDHLYKDLIPTFQPWPLRDDKKWMVIWFSSRKVSAFRNLKDADTVRQFMANFPFDKLYQPRLNVNIPASSGLDRGRIIVLWRKINTFVATIKTLHYIPFVHVTLSGRWIHGGKPMESVKDNNGVRPDHDIAILPFARLESWDFSLPKHLIEAISKNPSTSKNAVISELKANQLLSIGSSPSHIDKWLSETETFLESQIGINLGLTARDLYLEQLMKRHVENAAWEEECRQRVGNLPQCLIGFPSFIQASA